MPGVTRLRAKPQRLLPGQVADSRGRLPAGWRVRFLWPPGRRASWKIHSWTLRHRRPEHAGRGQPGGGELPLPAGAQRWPDDWDDPAQPDLEPSVQRREREIRFAEIPMDRTDRHVDRNDGRVATFARQHYSG